MTKNWYIGLFLCAFSVSTIADPVRGLPKEDNTRFPKVVIITNSCPFEGCGFGKWRVTEDMIVYDKPQSNKSIGSLKAGMDVYAVTATSFLYPAMARVTGDIPKEAKGIDPAKPLWIMEVGSEDGEREVRQGDQRYYLFVAINKKYCKKPIPGYKKNECWVDIIRDFRDEWWAYITVPNSDLRGWILVDRNIDTNNPLG